MFFLFLSGVFSGFILAVGVFPMVKFPMVKASCPLHGSPEAQALNQLHPTWPGRGGDFPGDCCLLGWLGGF